MILLVLAGWLVALSLLVALTANPVMVNRTQIMGADIVVQGTWIAGTPPRIEITRVWKGSWEPKSIEVHGALPVSIPTGEVIVPLQASRPSKDEPTTYRIAQGNLINSPLAEPEDGSLAAVTAEIQPLIYPALPDVIRQLEERLAEPVPPPVKTMNESLRKPPSGPGPHPFFPDLKPPGDTSAKP